MTVLTIFPLEIENLLDFRGLYTSLLMLKRLLCVLGIRREKFPHKQALFLPLELHSLRKSCGIEAQRPLTSWLTHNKRKGEDWPALQSIVKDL